ncbi:MAG: prepilin-type N-terminal cleavage/methylation domain-containing protein [Rubrivivax sp.]|jgi:type IV fimbrial biogenesis protein FimT|nr:prepilin-type N-terminal cleavage/methylation domain-containing protein [Rubrivivax sp.]
MPQRRIRAGRCSGTHAHGLTLIEAMIALAICAVLMSLALPSFAQYLQRQRLKAAAQGLELDLREARFEAARRGSPLYLAFQGGANWCYALATTPDCDCSIQQACRLKATRSTELRGVHLLAYGGVRFDPGSGQVDVPGVKALWAAPSGERVQVSVGAMGRPTVCMQEGSLPPWAPC